MIMTVLVDSCFLSDSFYVGLVGNIFQVCTSMFLIDTFPGINNVLFSRGSQQSLSLTEQYFYSSVCVHMEVGEMGNTLSLLCIIVNAKKMGKTGEGLGARLYF